MRLRPWRMSMQGLSECRQPLRHSVISSVRRPTPTQRHDAGHEAGGSGPSQSADKDKMRMGYYADLARKPQAYGLQVSYEMRRSAAVRETRTLLPDLRRDAAAFLGAATYHLRGGTFDDAFSSRRITRF